MSARIFPCHGCPIGKDCTHRKELSAKVRGLGLRSAAFPCERLAAELRPGRRVVISQPYRTDAPGYCDEDYLHQITRVDVPATINSVHLHYRPSVIVDKDAPRPDEDLLTEEEAAINKARFRRAMPHTRIIRFLDEPDRPLCKSGRVLLSSGECDHLDWPDDNGPCECRSVYENQALSKEGAQ